MTAEIGEHERAQSVSDSYPTPLRATLRAPPSKWAIKAFCLAGECSEPRSRTALKGLPQTEARDAQRGGPPLECRAAGFLLHTFLSPSREKCERPMGRQVPLPRRSRRVRPPQGNFSRQTCRIPILSGGFPLAPCTPSGRRKKSVSAPWDGKSHSRAGVGASGPHKGIFHGKLVASRYFQGAFRSPPAPLRAVEKKV